MKTRLPLLVASMVFATSAIAMNDDTLKVEKSELRQSNTVCSNFSEKTLIVMIKPLMECKFKLANNEGYSLEVNLVSSRLINLLAYSADVRSNKVVFDRVDFSAYLDLSRTAVIDYNASDWPDKEKHLHKAGLSINRVNDLILFVEESFSI